MREGGEVVVEAQSPSQKMQGRGGGFSKTSGGSTVSSLLCRTAPEDGGRKWWASVSEVVFICRE